MSIIRAYGMIMPLSIAGDTNMGSHCPVVNVLIIVDECLIWSPGQRNAQARGFRPTMFHLDQLGKAPRLQNSELPGLAQIDMAP